MDSELIAARSYLSARLSAALSIPVYPLGEVSASAAMPYVVYDVSPEPDAQSKTRTERASMEAVARVVGKGPLLPLAAHVAAIGEALDMRAGEARGFYVSSRRIAPFSLPVYYLEGGNVPIREMGIRARLALTRVSEVVGS